MDSKIENVKEVVRQAALKRMLSHSMNPDVVVSEISEDYDRRVHGNWMAIILISGKDLRFTFKVHFDIADIKKILKQSLGMEINEIGDSLATDFVKEFCNLSAGYIKQLYEEVEIRTGISLPIVTRGFDDIFYQPSNAEEVTDIWKVEVAGVSLICTPHINIYDESAIPQLDLEANDDEDDDDDGDIDFL